jgi:hypothetical protein
MRTIEGSRAGRPVARDDLLEEERRRYREASTPSDAQLAYRSLLRSAARSCLVLKAIEKRQGG